MRALAEETHDPTVLAIMLRFAANDDRVAGQAVDPAPEGRTRNLKASLETLSKSG
jgi:hypothetical protein